MAQRHFLLISWASFSAFVSTYFFSIFLNWEEIPISCRANSHGPAWLCRAKLLKEENIVRPFKVIWNQWRLFIRSKQFFFFKSKKSTQVKIGGRDQDRMTLTDQIFLLLFYLLVCVQGDKNVWGFEKKIKSKRHRQKEIVFPPFLSIPPPPSTRRKKKWNKITCKRGGFLDLPGFPPSPSCVGAAILFFDPPQHKVFFFFFSLPSRAPSFILPSLPHNNNNNNNNPKKNQKKNLSRLKVRFKQTHFLISYNHNNNLMKSS